MGAYRSKPLPLTGSEVNTACGGRTHFSSDTPHAIYNEKWVFFCLPACKEEFDRNPASSCLAEQITFETSK
jgi:YHS domain-containing protein